MIKTKILVFMTLLQLKSSLCFAACKPKVAVIGAGIGGASASHFLSQLFDKNVDIDVFESQTIGGRLATIQFDNQDYESGGSIIHSRNKYMTDFVKLLDLEHRPPFGSKFGIWNGKKFVFEESDWESVTFMKLLYRYGLQPVYLHRYVNKILDDFDNIYDHQEKGIGFENVTALIASMNKDFVKLLEIPIKDHLSSLDYGDKIINELVKATIVVNYNQDTNVQAFVAYVSVAGAGYDLWAVKGGNKQVPKKLIATNENVKIIPSTVEKIIRHTLGNIPKYEIIYNKKGEQNVTSLIYDIVIIAAPMTSDQKTQIEFLGFDDLELEFPGEYQTTIATFVNGKVNYSYFGLEEEIGGILSCDPVKTKINSIGKIPSVDGTESENSEIWKIFSKEELSDLEKMFSEVKEVKEIKWKAYPKYSAARRLDKFKLDDFMYYVNAIEWAASAMEMSAISGRNAAILAFNDYSPMCSLPIKRKPSSFEEESQTLSSEL